MEVESKHNPVSQPFCGQTPARQDLGNCPELVDYGRHFLAVWHPCSLKNINISERMKQMNLLTLFLQQLMPLSFSEVSLPNDSKRTVGTQQGENNL